MKPLKLLFIGSKEFGLHALKCIPPAQPIEAVLVLKDPEADFAGYCEKNKIPYHVVQNAEEAEKVIKSISPDLCFVVGWYRIFSNEILNTCKFIGIHNSLLPKYRGSSPLVWSIINGDEHVGYSIFEMTQGMDEGGVYHQSAYEMKSEYTIETILNRIKESLIIYIPLVLGKITGGARPLPQIEESMGPNGLVNHVSYCAARIEEDGLIDWNWPAERIHNFIRAQTKPHYPGAFTYFRGYRFTIWNSSVYLPIGHCYGTPGQVIKRFKDSVQIACGNNTAIEIFNVTYLGTELNAGEVLLSIKCRLNNIALNLNTYQTF